MTTRVSNGSYATLRELDADLDAEAAGLEKLS